MAKISGSTGQTTAGETFYLKVDGTNTQVDLRLANLLHHDAANGIVTVHGTDGDDAFEFGPTASLEAIIKGVRYHFDDSEVETVTFDGGDGYDTAHLAAVEPDSDDAAELWHNRATFDSAGRDFTLTNAESIEIAAGAGQDTVVVHDSPGDDELLRPGRDPPRCRTVRSGWPITTTTIRTTRPPTHIH